MGTNQDTDLLAEPQLAKVVLAQRLVALTAQVRSIWANNLLHFLGGWNESTNVMQESRKNYFLIPSELLRLFCQVGTLERMLQLGHSLAQVIPLALRLEDGEQLVDNGACLSLNRSESHTSDYTVR